MKSLHPRFFLALASTLPLMALSVAPNELAKDPIERMNARNVTLKYEKGQGYLRSLLAELKISADSQVLVFSKSSVQSDFINRKNPRAIYFNSNTYVGWIPGAPLIEIMTNHPTLGVMYYTIENSEKVKPVPDSQIATCRPCHGGNRRLIAESSIIAPSSYSRTAAPTLRVRPATPFQSRWGGWYVTGTHGAMRHMGNVVCVGTDEKPKIDPNTGANITSLSKYFDTKKYLTPDSDIVALLVFEHQLHLQNLLNDLNDEMRNGTEPLKSACEPVVRALLAAGEANFTDKIKGTTSYAASYGASAPKDSLGRSFSELDLATRLHKYFLSPMIYSESFVALPADAKAQIYRRINAVCSGTELSPAFRHLTDEAKIAINEIASATIPDYKRAIVAK